MFDHSQKTYEGSFLFVFTVHFQIIPRFRRRTEDDFNLEKIMANYGPKVRSCLPALPTPVFFLQDPFKCSAGFPCRTPTYLDPMNFEAITIYGTQRKESEECASAHAENVLHAHVHSECLSSPNRSMEYSLILGLVSPSGRKRKGEKMRNPDINLVRAIAWDASLGFQVVFEPKDEPGFAWN